MNEDAEALFRIYLAEHPPARQWAEDVSRIYERTRAAINAKTTEGYAGHETSLNKRHPVLQLKWPSFARWAAAVIFGTLIGFAAGRWQTSEKTYRMAWPEPGRNTEQVEAVSDLKDKYAGTFWADKMLALLKHKPGRQYEADFQGVRFWDRYRQYIKEKHHE